MEWLFLVIFDKIYATHLLTLKMDQRREKVKMDQRREKEGVVILSHFDKIYATHMLKLRMDQRREKRGSGYS